MKKTIAFASASIFIISMFAGCVPLKRETAPIPQVQKFVYTPETVTAPKIVKKEDVKRSSKCITKKRFHKKHHRLSNKHKKIKHLKYKKHVKHNKIK